MRLRIPIFVVLLLGGLVRECFACATCFGQSNDDLARGMNAGILSLLAVVAVVLSGFTTFFVYLAKRSAAVHATASEESTTDARSSG